MYDYSKLRGKIKEVYVTQSNFASAIKLSSTSISAKLNNNVDWKQEEIENAVKVLGIDCEKIPEYFFIQKVEKNQTKGG